MFGVDAYGSDSSDNEDAPQVKPAPVVVPKPAAPKAKKPVRIVVDALPKQSRSLDDADDDDRPAKKPRVELGKGRSSLLSMLPAPKAAPAAPPKPAPSTNTTTNDPDADETEVPAKPTMLVPTAVKKAAASSTSAAPPKPKPAVNFFSFGESSASSSSRVEDPLPKSSIQISSAPEIQEYQPPEPTPTDPYPGYYQMPNGQWAAYEPSYYKTFWDRWQAEAAGEAGSSAQPDKGFEGLDEDNMDSFSALDAASRARAEIEDTKNITKNIKTGPEAPRMNIAKTQKNSLANQRHQLSTLLYTAYQNREAIEEKIAIGRRNRKESGNKYGF